jgi:hypothetical protein
MSKAPFSEDRLNRVHKRARCRAFPALSIANPSKAAQFRHKYARVTLALRR